MDSNVAKANQFMEEAEEKLKPRGILSRIIGKTRSVDEAISLYEKAGNCFKMAKEWKKAGDAFVLVAGLHEQTHVKHEAASKYVEAANCFREVNPSESIKNLFKAIDIYTESGKFTMAAKHHTTAGEIYEKSLPDKEQAIAQYQKAADYYLMEQATSQASKCLLKVGEFSMQLEQYEKAIQIYDQLGKKAMENKLLQYGAKDYFYKAVLCMLCVDLVNGQKGIKDYESMYPMFTDSREYKLLKQMITCLETENADGYSAAIKEHDSISRIDPILIKLMLKIKNLYLHVEEQEVAGDGDIN